MTTEPEQPAEGDGDAGEPAVHAAPGRPRGLEAWFAPGGEDEADEARRADERRMLRLLVLMIVLLVGIPTLLTFFALAQSLVTRGSG